MPQGDRNILKADIEDGYGKVANLLIEALAYSKLNGVQKGICLFIVRRTYSWGKKDDEIPLKDIAHACNTSESYISKQLTRLIDWNVVSRTNYQPGKTPTYSINTRVVQWYKGCIDVQGLNECARKGLYKCTREGLHKCARVDTPETVEPLDIETTGKKGLKKDKEIITDDIGTAVDEKNSQEQNPMIIIQKALQKSGVLMPSNTEIESLLKWIEEGLEFNLIIYAIEKAALAGKRRVDYINGILNGFIRQGITTKDQAEAADEEYQRSKIEKKTQKTVPKNKGSSQYSIYS
jgi:phage replication O-like protein O